MKCKGCPLTALEGKEYCPTCELILFHEGQNALEKPKKDIGPFEKRLEDIEGRITDITDMLVVILQEFRLYDVWIKQREYRKSNKMD